VFLTRLRHVTHLMKSAQLRSLRCSYHPGGTRPRAVTLYAGHLWDKPPAANAVAARTCGAPE